LTETPGGVVTPGLGDFEPERGLESLFQTFDIGEIEVPFTAGNFVLSFSLPTCCFQRPPPTTSCG